MRAHSLVEPVEHPIDEYVRLRGEVTMLQAQCAEVLGRIDGEGCLPTPGISRRFRWCGIAPVIPGMRRGGVSARLVGSPSIPIFGLRLCRG